MVGRRSGWFRLFSFELFTLFLSPLPGALGLFGRGALLPLFLRSCARGVTLGRSVTIRCPKRISLGRGVILDDYSVVDYREDGEKDGEILLEDHVLLGRSSLVIAKGGRIHLKRGCNVSSFCRIATQSKVEIGEGTLIGAYSYIGPGNHQTDNTGRPIIEQNMDIRGGVSIGRDVWIGAHTTILDGVTIGEGAVVGAHSFVRSDVPARAVVAGVPARIIRHRDKPSTASAEMPCGCCPTEE